MKNVKTRSVGAAPAMTSRRGAKAMTGLMLCAVLALSACGQKRPLQLPQKTPAAKTTPSAAPAASAASAAS
ncbi:LPS translocon maturation chaperone LptM [Roseateles chitosanitabidus]|uniref:LPS translocon maturation chaperone LptM n=1 Tax=Roseateles chitosanitabidus TaxID=65048 RepID=UPI0011DFF22D|nr:lipoprotein [Roseateles chitosanitabidus]MBO9686972.1 lipoprotein [Roseateles chitosanitabidus]